MTNRPYILLHAAVIAVVLLVWQCSSQKIEDEPSAVSSEDGRPCCEVQEGTRQTDVLIVSTMDGQLTALDVRDGGHIMWSFNPTQQPLVSGTLTSMKVVVNDWVYRIIPSLHGHLYMYFERTGDLRPVPVDAAQLLSSSLRFGEDVIAGGLTVNTYGVDVVTGQLLYTCTVDGCVKEEVPSVDPHRVLVVKRHRHTLRAVHAVTGHQQWNVSVAEHNIEMATVPRARRHCATDDDVHFAIRPPDGQVDASKGNMVLWRVRMESPIVQTWRWSPNLGVCELSLFDADVVPPLGHVTDGAPLDSLMYLGTYEGAPYIMLSNGERMKMSSSLSSSHPEPSDDHHAVTPFAQNDRMVLRRGSQVEQTLRSLETIVEEEGCVGDDLCSEESCSADDAAVFDVEPTSSDKGWYLYKHVTPHRSWLDAPSRNLRGTSNEDNVTMSWTAPFLLPLIIAGGQSYVLHMLLLCGATAVFTVWLTRHYQRTKYDSIIGMMSRRRPREEEGVEAEEEKPAVVLARRSTPNTTSTSNHTSITNTSTEGEYVSRFLADFEPVSCLGKGGFGTVFECRNRFDSIYYAVKRIPVLDTKRGRERVMREVKSLATLDHPNIVRYFQSWIETPPLQWQRSVDRDMMDRCVSATSPNLQLHTQPSLAVSFDDVSSVWTDDRGDTKSESSIDVPRARPSAPPSDSLSIVFAATHEGEEETEEDSGGSDESRTTMYLYIQMQLCSAYTLRDWLMSNTGERRRQTMMHWFAQITDAINYVHTEHSLVHRDLKPSNIFFAPNGVVKVGDFGLCTITTPRPTVREGEEEGHGDGDMTDGVGTRLYMSPEQLAGDAYTNKIDIYALALILAELMVPCRTQMQRVALLEDIRRQSPNDDLDGMHVDDRCLVACMSSRSPSARPSCADVLRRPNLVEAMQQLHYTPMSLRKIM